MSKNLLQLTISSVQEIESHKTEFEKQSNTK